MTNPSLEADANNDGIPDCWQLGGFGNNTYNWSRVTDAHDGTYAEMLQILSYTDSDRKLVNDQHNVTCEPAANVGHSYTFGAWYHSDQPVFLVAYYQNASGSWVWWAQSPVQAASSTYRHATWTSPAVPTGAVRLSFGLSLRSVGTVTMDDFTLTQN